MKRQVKSLFLCSILLVAFVITMLPFIPQSKASVVSQSQVQQYITEARAQIEAKDYTRLSEPVQYKMLWLGFTRVKYSTLDFRMTEADKEYLRDVAKEFELTVRIYSRNNIQVDIDLYFVDEVLPLTKSSGADWLYFDQKDAQRWIDKYDTNEQYDSVITAVESKGSENELRNQDKAEYEIHKIMLGLKTAGVENGLGYSTFELGTRKRGKVYAGQMPTPLLGATPVAVHEWMHQIESLGTFLGIEYPDTHAYQGKIPGYSQYFANQNNSDYNEFYELVLSGKLPYTRNGVTQYVGMYPKMYRLIKRNMMGSRTAIRYDANGGTAPPAMQSVINDIYHTARFIHPNMVPVRNGFAFIGWRLNNSKNNAIEYCGDMITYATGVSVQPTVLNYYAQWAAITTIQYNTNGGTGTPARHQVANELDGLAHYNLSKSEPVRAGFKFLGWRLNDDSTNYAIDKPGQKIAYPVGNEGATTLTYYAQWAAITTIQYNGNGGTGIPSSHTVVNDVSDTARFILSTKEPVRVGYVFLGWRLNDSTFYVIDKPGKSIAYPTGKLAKKTLTYYAQWAAITTVQYHTNGGSAGPGVLKVANDEDGNARFTISNTRPIRTGFVFVGWRYNNDISFFIDEPGKSITFPTGNAVPQTLHYYAQWVAVTTVEYDKNDGTGVFDSQTVINDLGGSARFTLRQSGPYRSGFVFKGWRLNNSSAYSIDAGGKSISIQTGNERPSTLTYYAQWIAITTIKYDANKGSGAPGMSAVTNDSSGYARFSLSSVKPTRTGFVFRGWRLDNETANGIESAGKSITYQSGNTEAKTLTYYAQWLAQTTIKFNANGGSGAPVSIVVTNNDDGYANFIISKTTPSKSGFYFNGWRLNNNSANSLYKAGQSVKYLAGNTSTKTLTYYAQWLAITTVKYNGNGGSNIPQTVYITNNESGQAKFVLSTIKPIRSGYTFQGWRLNNSTTYAIDGSGKSITFPSGNATPRTLIYFAQWKATVTTPTQQSTSIQYNANGGYNAPQSHTVKNDVNGYARFTLSTIRPLHRSGYTFVGWRLNNSASFAIDKMGQSITYPSGNIKRTILTYYAQWK